MKLTRAHWIIALTAMPVIGADLWSKHWAEAFFLHEGQQREVLSWFSLRLVYNYSAAFGMFEQVPQVARTALLLLLVPAVLVLLGRIYIRRFGPNDVFGPAVAGLIFGGALGNFIDRLSDGRVTDLIDWHYESSGQCLPLFHHFTATSCHWPVFNLADCAITLAIILLFSSQLVESRRSRLSSDRRRV